MTKKQLENQARIAANNAEIVGGLVGLMINARNVDNWDTFYTLKSTLAKILGNYESVYLEMARWYVEHQDEKDWYRQEAKNNYADFLAKGVDENTEGYFEALNFKV